MKIAIIMNEGTTEKCIGSGCHNAFNSRSDAFSGYDELTELVHFTHSGENMDNLIQELIEEKVDTIHLSTCCRSKLSNYEELAKKLSSYFNVIGYTHGSESGKTRETVFLTKL